MTFEKWFQSRLTAHGFAVGGIDGNIGPTTMAAARAFQRSRGLAPTGVADPNTVKALRASSTALERPLAGRDDLLVGRTQSSFPKQSGVAAFYGDVGTNQSSIIPPWTMRLAWDKRRTIKRMTLHERVCDSAERAMARVYDQYGNKGIKLLGLDMFGGSLNVRRMRGGSKYSMHAWGIAIDWDPERNRLRWNSPQARLSRADVIPFWEIWEDEGWVSLGRERDFDWMHVQAARLG